MTELQDRMAPMSVAITIGAMLRMLVVLEPDRDWTLLGDVYRHLKRTATPSRDKLSRMVPATDLLALGVQLMGTWADFRRQRVYKATQFRDGLMIALLICCPMRLRNLTEIVIGRHLIFDGQAYRLEFTGAETKTGRPYVAAVPAELTPYAARRCNPLQWPTAAASVDDFGSGISANP